MAQAVTQNNHSAGFTSADLFGWLITVAVAAAAVRVGILLFYDKPLFGMLGLGGLAAVLLIPFPRHAFFLFVASLAVFLPTRFSPLFVLHPMDILMGVVFMGMVLEFLLHGETKIRPTFFDLPFIAFIVGITISGLFAYRVSYSVVPIMRVAVIYLAARMIFKFALELGVRRIILFYIYIVAASSLINFGIFLYHGGQMRVFGLASLGYEPLAMTALPMAVAFMVWAEKPREQLKFGLMALIIGFGIIATQSRAPLLAVLIAVPVLVWLTSRKAAREQAELPRRTIRKVFIPLGIAGGVLILTAVSWGLLTDAFGRYEELANSIYNPQGTIALRLILWKSAWLTFLDHPLTGVGIGNFRIVHELYPEMRLAPLWLLVRGMSAHNVVLHYLAETGLIGTLTLLVLTVAGFRTAWRALKARTGFEDTQVTMAVFIAMFVFCLTILYMRAWTWGQDGYIMAMIFGLTAAWSRTLTPEKSS